MFNTQILAGSSGQGGETQQSLKFNDDENPYLLRTPTTAGNRQTWSISMWVKRGNLGISQAQLFEAGTSGGSGSRLFWYFNSSDQIQLSSGTVNYGASGARSLRDPSAWYHILIQCSGGSVKHYINGELDITHSISGDTAVNSLVPHAIFSRADSTGTNSMDGYVAQVALFDGTAYTTADVTNTENGVLTVKSDLSGLTFGTNGFHLTFQDDVVSEGFNAVTYRGTGGTQSVSGLGLEADLLWIKKRSSADNHGLFDSIRGANGRLQSDSTDAESTTGGQLTSFDSDGFTLSSTAPNQFNQSGQTFVAWGWDAGSGSAASNTDGSITSTVKANPDYGFSIGTFTKGSGTETFGHGLTSAPELLILKRRDSTGSWFSYSSVTDATKWIRLNGTDAATTGSTFWNNTAPTSSVATISTAYNSGEQLVFYAFNSVAGYSSIGSYSGTGAAGNAVTGLGFKPAWLMIKRTDNAQNWRIYDNTRDTTNPRNILLFPDDSGAEATSSTYDVDFDANGFTLDGTNAASNASGGTYIYMAFADTREAAFWKDVSGQGNHWTPNNLDYRDSLIDSPANNFATFNSIHTDNTITLSEGNLKIVHGYDSGVGTTFGFNPSDATGYYAEFYKIVGTYGEIGIAPTNISDLSKPSTAGKNGYMLYLSSGQKANNGSYTTYGSAVAAGDIVSVAVKDGKIWWGVNGVWIAGGDPENGTNPAFSGISGEYFFIQAYDTNAGTALQTIANFGQDSTFSGARPAGGNVDDNGIGDFAYAPPSGYLALCTANLPTPTIIDGSEHFNTVLYTGNATDNRAITGVGFQPDWVWLKTRSVADNHVLNDSVRGGNKQLFSNSTDQEFTGTSLLKTFDSDGFTLGTDSAVNGSGRTLAAWNWKAGGTAVSNTDGSITSQVSANVDAGFSIASYTGNGGVQAGDNVGHGLLQTPEVIIVKNRNAASNWNAWWSTFVGSNQVIYPNLTNAQNTDANVWSSTLPTSNVFYVGNGEVNGSGQSHIAYCFHSVEGFSKAGSYVANQSTNGTFIYLGFRPAFFLAKNISRSQEWIMMNNKTTDPYNPQDGSIQPNSSAAEGTGNEVDFLSNGVKLRNSGGGLNYASGDTFIYLAFAENPFKYANAR